MYIGPKLGDDWDDYYSALVTTPVYDYPIYQEPERTSTFPITMYDNWQSVPVAKPVSQPVSSGSWWDTLTASLVPISTAASNIIRAVSGQPANNISQQNVPAGYIRNAQGQIVPIASSTGTFAGQTQSWLMPALLGVGAVMLLKNGKSRK